MALDCSLKINSKLDIKNCVKQFYESDFNQSNILFIEKYKFSFSYNEVDYRYSQGIYDIGDYEFHYTSYVFFSLDKLFNESYRVPLKNIIDFLSFLITKIEGDFLFTSLDLELLSRISGKMEFYSIDNFWHHYKFHEEMKIIQELPSR